MIQLRKLSAQRANRTAVMFYFCPVTDQNMDKAQNLGNINVGRLFLGSNFSLIATSVTFAIIGAIMGPLKEIFVLTNAEVGFIGGAALWGFSITIYIFAKPKIGKSKQLKRWGV